jgi:hypothetical protein
VSIPDLKPDDRARLEPGELDPRAFHCPCILGRGRRGARRRSVARQ